MEKSDDVTEAIKGLNQNFQEDPPRIDLEERNEADILLLKIDGFEGPIEVLLEHARNQKARGYR